MLKLMEIFSLLFTYPRWRHVLVCMMLFKTQAVSITCGTIEMCTCQGYLDASNRNWLWVKRGFVGRICRSSRMGKLGSEKEKDWGGSRSPWAHQSAAARINGGSGIKFWGGASDCITMVITIYPFSPMVSASYVPYWMILSHWAQWRRGNSLKGHHSAIIKRREEFMLICPKT